MNGDPINNNFNASNARDKLKEEISASVITEIFFKEKKNIPAKPPLPPAANNIKESTAKNNVETLKNLPNKNALGSKILQKGGKYILSNSMNESDASLNTNFPNSYTSINPGFKPKPSESNAKIENEEDENAALRNILNEKKNRNRLDYKENAILHAENETLKRQIIAQEAFLTEMISYKQTGIHEEHSPEALVSDLTKQVNSLTERFKYIEEIKEELEVKNRKLWKDNKKLLKKIKEVDKYSDHSTISDIKNWLQKLKKKLEFVSECSCEVVGKDFFCVQKHAFQELIRSVQDIGNMEEKLTKMEVPPLIIDIPSDPDDDPKSKIRRIELGSYGLNSNSSVDGSAFLEKAKNYKTGLQNILKKPIIQNNITKQMTHTKSVKKIPDTSLNQSFEESSNLMFISEKTLENESLNASQISSPQIKKFKSKEVTNFFDVVHDKDNPTLVEKLRKLLKKYIFFFCYQTTNLQI